MNPFVDNLRVFFSRLSSRQKVAIGSLLGGSIVIFGSIAYWVGRPDYALLFAGLGPTDANQIVETLRTERVPYQLRENGTAVFVPRDKVYDLRLSLAGQGKVSDGISGYELFNQNTLGMTDFMQKLNFKRALEGELARTVSNIRQVEMCRVHLVIPERSPFREAQNRPSASVVLKMRGSPLSSAQIEGITSLVAGAVEGLSPSDVTILDNRGNLLSDPSAGDTGFQTSNAQIRMQREVESHLMEKGQSMLDQVLGSGNAIIRVTAALDFSRAIVERETIDPESATVISEERLEEEVESGNASSMVRNFEMSRSRERSEKNLGDVSYLTVSVILNHKRENAELRAVNDGGDPFVAYTEEELAEIEALVKNAVGFRPDRGDRFALHQTRFDTSMDDQVIAELRAQHQREQVHTYIRYGILLLGIAAAFWLLRSLYTRMAEQNVPIDAGFLSQRKPEAVHESRNRQLTGGEDDDEPDDRYLNKLAPDARKHHNPDNHAYEQVISSINESPETAANLVRSWIHEETSARG